MREAHALSVKITQAEVQALRDKCEELPMTCGRFRRSSTPY
jgi:hypothetical protein